MLLTPLVLLASMLHAGPERVLVPPLPEASPYSELVTAVAPGDDAALIVWLEEESGTFAAARVDRDGRRLDQRPIALAEVDQAARGRDGWLLAGHDGLRIVGQFVDDDGIAGQPFTIDEAEHVERVRIAFDGTYFLVVWNLRSSFRAARLDASGNVVERDIFFVAASQYNEVELVALDRGFGIVTLHYDLGLREFTVEVFRLDENAQVLSYGWLDRTSTASLSNLHVATDGNTLAATWQGVRVGGHEVFLAREGQPLRVIAGNRTPIDLFVLGGKVHTVLLEPGNGEVSIVPEDETRVLTWPSTLYSITAGSFGDRALLVATTLGIHGDAFTKVVDPLLDEVVPSELLALDPVLQERPAIARGPNGDRSWSGRRHATAATRSLPACASTVPAGRSTRSGSSSPGSCGIGGSPGHRSPPMGRDGW